MKEKTFAMIKPDAVHAGYSGQIIDAIEKNGFTIVRMEKRTIDEPLAKKFYGVHATKPFFGELVQQITSGPVIVLMLEKEGAIAAWRTLMGATDPQKSAEGTLRRRFGSSIGMNAVHGSDMTETAKTELALFFPK
jgi:nucleoside-diphosphate kinase